MEWLEVTAPSVEAAKERALDSLGVHESDAEFEIVTEGKTRLLGLMKEDARIRARILPTPVRPKKSRLRNSRRSKSSAQRSGRAAGKQHNKRSKPVSRNVQKHGNVLPKSQKADLPNSKRRGRFEKQADLVEDFLSGIAETMDLSLKFTRYNLEDDVVCIEANGDNIGVLIGQRRATALAIDDLAKTILQRSGYLANANKVRVDIGGVESRRRAALSEFAKKIADEVLECGEDIRMEPMSSGDRKIIHDTVAKIDGVGTRSEGNDALRHVVIGVFDEPLMVGR